MSLHSPIYPISKRFQEAEKSPKAQVPCINTREYLKGTRHVILRVGKDDICLFVFSHYLRLFRVNLHFVLPALLYALNLFPVAPQLPILVFSYWR